MMIFFKIIEKTIDIILIKKVLFFILKMLSMNIKISYKNIEKIFIKTITISENRFYQIKKTYTLQILRVRNILALVIILGLKNWIKSIHGLLLGK